MTPLRLIIVDDHIFFIEMLEIFLQRYDCYDVVGVANDALGAMEKARDTQPDLILLDINLPDRNGLDIIPELRQTIPDVAIIMLTIFNLPVYREAADSAGANGFVLKQNLFDDLIPEIERVSQIMAFSNP